MNISERKKENNIILKEENNSILQKENTDIIKKENTDIIKKEINHKYYETIVIKNGENYKEIIKSLEIVKNYITKNNKILVGGMAIDFSLKLKGDKLYDDDVLPDYDFYSDEHHIDAYNIAKILHRKGFENISVINARHPSTLRVRINLEVVADITFIPSKILNNIPFLFYKGIRIVHPHYQMIDQHRSLSHPYENAPWETIQFRAIKDMKRYDMLYNHYPLRKLNIGNNKVIIKDEKKYKIDIFKDQCIGGFVALNYWIKQAKQLGFKTQQEFGIFEINNTEIRYSFPLDSHGISVYTDDWEYFFKKIKSIDSNIIEERYYNRFLDKLPKKIILNNDWEIFDNIGNQITAIKLREYIYISDLQHIMLYLLTNYILLQKIQEESRGLSFYLGYKVCRDLIIWAGNRWKLNKKEEIYSQFLPTGNIYGKKNENEAQMLQKLRFDIKNGLKNEMEMDKYKQPKPLYDRDLNNFNFGMNYFKFDPTQSELFDFDGRLIKKS